MKMSVGYSPKCQFPERPNAFFSAVFLKCVAYIFALSTNDLEMLSVLCVTAVEHNNHKYFAVLKQSKIYFISCFNICKQ